MAPSWGGEAASGAEALWGRETMADMAHDSFASGNEYTLRVRASNAGGDSDWSEGAAGTPQVSAPERPGPPDVTPGDGTLELTWPAAAGADSYTVQWRSGTQEYMGTRQRTVDTPSVTLTGLTNSTEYTLRVRASNAGGDSDWSEEAAGTPMTPVPALPPAGGGLLGLLLALLGRRLRT